MIAHDSVRSSYSKNGRFTSKIHRGDANDAQPN